MTATFRIEELKFMPEINYIIKDNFRLFPQDVTHVELSTSDEDTKESFDLVYNSRIEISVRIRNNEYLKYCDFTIRSRSKYGNLTEIDKIASGKGSIYLYAWKTKDNLALQTWLLVDINRIRDELVNSGVQRYNSDGTGFRAYNVIWLSSRNAIIAYCNMPDYYTNGSAGLIHYKYEPKL